MEKLDLRTVIESLEEGLPDLKQWVKDSAQALKNFNGKRDEELANKAIKEFKEKEEKEKATKDRKMKEDAQKKAKKEANRKKAEEEAKKTKESGSVAVKEL